MKHFVLPDVQAKPGVDFTYLERIGKYVVEKQPDKIICLGDFADMESLSSYDRGTKSFEGRRYVKDIEAAKLAMTIFLTPMWDYNAAQRKNGKKQYKPELILTLGNHENRINRAVNDDAKLDGVLSITDLGYKDFGWTVHPFLEVVVIDGVVGFLVGQSLRLLRVCRKSTCRVFKDTSKACKCTQDTKPTEQ
jgi:hypothetical protein